MARSLETIYNQIIDEKKTFTVLNTLTPINDNFQSLLSNLTSTSKVAIWRLWIYLVALAIWFHEQVFDAHKTEVEQMILDNQLGQLRWYVTKAKAFQNGYDLSWDGSKYVYVADDPDSQIVNQASALDGDSVVLIKIATYVDPANPNTSELEALSAAEEAAFEAYLTLIKPAGIQTQVINADPDDLIVDINIMYDPLLITANGELIEDSTITTLKAGEKPAEDSFDTYLKSIPFDSKFRVVDMVDALQAAEGVENVVVNQCDARSGTNPYSDILAEYDQQYTTNSGYFKPSTSVTSTFTYYQHT
ncbi:MAG: hypothetical protein GY861_05465 [bacterium]|nr:hypothetical protein [bacterium]